MSSNEEPQRLRTAIRLVWRRYWRQVRTRPALAAASLLLPGIGNIFVHYIPALAIANLLGDLWVADAPPSPEAALAEPAARLHLYGKRDARAGRKMGHVSAVGANPAEALRRVQDAYDRFKPASVPNIER